MLSALCFSRSGAKFKVQRMPSVISRFLASVQEEGHLFLQALVRGQPSGSGCLNSSRPTGALLVRLKNPADHRGQGRA